MNLWPNNTRRYAAFLFLCSLLLAGDRVLAQPIVTDLQNPAATRAIEQFKQQDKGLNASDQEAKLKRYPLVVFIPGIMGSKIEECDRGATKNEVQNCKFIWGQKEWYEGRVNMSIKPGKAYRTDVLDNFKALGQETEFYGDGLAFLHDQYISNYPTLIPFSYDWRQDNRNSAYRLHEFLCALEPTQKSRPIIFVAHSMGGLVLKYWFARLYGNAKCPSGEELRIDIDEFMFVGTPHYGAPEAIKAFAEGFKLDDSSGGVFGMIKRFYKRQIIAEELNKYGTMFPSVYQLLPIYDDSCVSTIRKKIDLPNAISTMNSGVFELFHAGAWRQVGWPMHIPDSVTAKDFYEKHLPTYLSDARDFLCIVAKLTIPESIRVSYFSSNASDTNRNFTLKLIPPNNERAKNPVTVGFEKSEVVKGDGTVPYEIAINATDSIISHSRSMPNEKHEYLLNSREFRERISLIYKLKSAEVMENLLRDPKAAGALRKAYLDFGDNLYATIPSSGDLNRSADSADVKASFPNLIRFNQSLMEARGRTPGDLRRLAEQSGLDRDAAVGAVLLALQTPASDVGGSNDTIKVGVLHSLSGTTAVSETALKDTVLFLIDEQNKKGGVLGKKLEAVVADPASELPLFAEKARELIADDKVSVVFGSWTSASRKSVLPVFKELNSILFYPAQYEGEESERNVFYTGAAPNQQAIPAVDYLSREEKIQRWVLAGTDYVYPRTTNKILEAYLKSKGVAQEDIMISYTPFGHSDWQTVVADIKKFGSAGKKTAVVSTINGDANVSFYKELANQGIKATDIPVVAFSVGEEELAGIDTKPLLGHLAASNYFESIKTPENEKFVKGWQAYTKNPKRVTNDPMEAHVIGFEMWVKAVEKAKSTDADKVIDALPGIEAKNLTGTTSKMLPNHHITKPVFIGEIKANGQLDVVWTKRGLVAGDAWSKELSGSKDLIGDWVGKKCGNYNTKTNKCGGQAE